jgi:4-hydroxy-3-polyprenylbenzoate decarboxylase
MSYECRNLSDLVARLEREGELRRIRAEVDPILEITEIADRVSKRMGPALLFERVKNSAYPVLINVFGSYRRTALALGVSNVEEIARRVQDMLDFKAPASMLDKFKMLPLLADLGALLPKTVKSAPCQEIVRTERFSLLDFPILQCWPLDGGRFITLPLVFSKHPQTGRRNCGMYRMQVFDERTTGMHWQVHKHGAQHYREARRQAADSPAPRRMPVAVAVGAEPAVVFAALAPLPDDLDEMMFAGFLRREPVEMVACKTIDLEVPAEAEIVLEGYVDLDELRLEGPFGDHTGFYSLADQYPVFRVTCLTHRRNPLYHTTIVGKPPQEDCYLGHAVERIFLPLLRKQLPEIEDLHMPFEGVFHNLALVSIRKRYPGHARKIMHALWGLGQLMFSKCIVVLDQDVNLREPGEVVWKALNQIDPERDIQFALGPVDSLDHASRIPNFGSKMGVDATRKWPEEGFSRAWPEEITMSAGVKQRVDAMWAQLGLE